MSVFGALALVACGGAQPPGARAFERGHPLTLASDITQRAVADVPASLTASTPITHDATLTSLDRTHACFAVTLRAVAGETARLHNPVSWRPRLRVDGPSSEADLVEASIRIDDARTNEARASRLVRFDPPIACGEAAWPTLIPALPLLLIAPIASLVWLATEMPRHQNRCRAAERTGTVDDGTAEVESVSAAVCFASGEPLARDATGLELRIDDPVRNGSVVRWRWSLSN